MLYQPLLAAINLQSTSIQINQLDKTKQGKDYSFTTCMNISLYKAISKIPDFFLIRHHFIITVIIILFAVITAITVTKYIIRTLARLEVGGPVQTHCFFFFYFKKKNIQKTIKRGKLPSSTAFSLSLFCSKLSKRSQESTELAL